jgi:hypothetical protein
MDALLILEAQMKQMSVRKCHCGDEFAGTSIFSIRLEVLEDLCCTQVPALGPQE